MPGGWGLSEESGLRPGLGELAGSIQEAGQEKGGGWELGGRLGEDEWQGGRCRLCKIMVCLESGHGFKSLHQFLVLRFGTGVFLSLNLSSFYKVGTVMYL